MGDIAITAAVEVIRCMCGGEKCRYCGRSVSSTCSPARTHCPCCGCPIAEPINDALTTDASDRKGGT